MSSPAPSTAAERVGSILAPAALPILLLAPALLRGSLLYGYDTIGELYPWWTWAWKEIAHGNFPHWNPNLLCGLPFHGLGVVSLAYPLSLVNLVLDPPRAITLWCMVHLMLAGWFTQRHARSLGCTPAAAALAGMTFAGSEALVSRITAGELPQLAVVTWVPAAWWLIEDALRRSAPVRLAFAAVPIGLMVLAGHLQYVVYGSVLIAGYATARVIGDASLRKRPAVWLGLLVCWPLGAALSAHQLLPTLDALRDSHRHLGLVRSDGGDILLAPASLIRFIAPDFLGNEYTSTYVGPSVATQTPLYFGLVPLVLVIVALRRRSPKAWTLAALAAGCIAYAFGDRAPLAPLARAIAPALGGFRIPSRVLVLGALPLSLLAGLGLDSLRGRAQVRSGQRWPRVAAGCGIALVILTLLAIVTDVPGAHGTWLRLTEMPPIAASSARLDIAWTTARGAAVRATLLLLLTALATTMVQRRGASSRWPTRLTLCLAFVDLAFHASTWVRVSPPEVASMAVELDRVAEALEPGASRSLGDRVLSKVPVRSEPRPASFVDGYDIGDAPGEVVPNWLATRGFRSVTGEIGLIPARTVLYTGNVGRYSIASVTSAARLDALAVHSVVTASSDGGTGDPFTALAVVRRQTALPLAFLARRILPVADAADAARHLDGAPGGMLDPRVETLIEGTPPSSVRSPALEGSDEPGDARLLVFENDRLDISVDSRRPGWLVILEPFARRWTATVDDLPATIHPAHVMFRAVGISAGHHLVKLRYVPVPFWVGVGLAMASSLALLLCLAAQVPKPSLVRLPSASGRR